MCSRKCEEAARLSGAGPLGARVLVGGLGQAASGQVTGALSAMGGFETLLGGRILHWRILSPNWIHVLKRSLVAVWKRNCKTQKERQGDHLGSHCGAPYKSMVVCISRWLGER